MAMSKDYDQLPKRRRSPGTAPKRTRHDQAQQEVRERRIITARPNRIKCGGGYRLIAHHSKD